MRRLTPFLTMVLLLAACGGHTTTTKTVTSAGKATPALTPVPGHPCTANNFYMACAGTAPGQALNPPTGGQAVFGVDTYGDPVTYLHAAFDVTYVPYSGKGWTRSGLAAWVHAGKQAGLVYESAAARALYGYSAGVADARYALQYANYLGFPSYTVIFFAVDTETSAGSVARYFQGVHAVLGSRTGVYGSYTIVTGLEYIYHLVTPRSMWQTVAWSYGRRSNACLYQAGINQYLQGQSIDPDYAICADFGQFPVRHEPICFGRHAVGNATCRQVHRQIAGWRKAETASRNAYEKRGCPQLTRDRDKLAQRFAWYRTHLDRYPNVRRTKRKQALKATGKVLTARRQALSGRGCVVFADRARFFTDQIAKTTKRYS